VRISEIHIYGYGNLENLVINNLSKMQVFYGENEAGKSTIMSFIHSVLFGFPTKQQSELRYEPKNHTKYGGKLILQHPTEGQVVIERVKGKATGFCVVKLENGTVGGEELLSQLFQKMDKSMFQSIFSFNLNGLQNIHHVKSEDIGKFLFSTSAVGTDKLLMVENELKKELENRFKPGGKKPMINEKIKELQELQIKVNEAKEKNDSYATLIENRIELEASIQAIQEEMKDLYTKIRRMNDWKKHFPNVQELVELNIELEQLESFHFPIDGMKRLDSFMQVIKPLEAQVTGLVEKNERLKDQLTLIKTNPILLAKKEEVESALANLPLDDQLATESLEIKYQLESLQIRIRGLREQLFYSMDNQDISKIDTSIFMKEKISQSQGKLVRLKDQKQDLDSRFQDEKTALEQLENEISFLERQLLTDQEKDSLLQEMKKAISFDQSKRELKEVEEKIEYLEKMKKTENTKPDKSKGQTIFILLFFLFLAIWSGFNEEWELLLASIASLVFLLFLYTKKKPVNVNSSPDDLLGISMERKQELVKELSSSNSLDSQLVQAKIQHDDKLREQLHSMKLRWNQQQLRYEQIIQAYEKWEMESKSQEALLSEVYQQLNLPSQIPYERIVDAFQIITDLKVLLEEEQRLQVRLMQIEGRRTIFHTTIIKLADQFVPNKKGKTAELVIILRDRLKEAQQNDVHAETIRLKMEEIEMDLYTIKSELQFLLNNLAQLFKEAGVASENEFRSKAIEAKRMEDLVGRKKMIESQLKLSGFSIEDYQQYERMSQIDDQIVEWNQRYNQLEELNQTQQDKLADIKFQITLLEEGGIYTELLHRYKQRKYEFDEQARIWGSYAVAKHLLAKTIEKYKNEKLPFLLKRAEEYLSFLTMGSYIHIHTKENGGTGFIIERNDHTLFEANELSQATMEQVYVSIRLALATNLFDHDKFPIIIDDSFVNFDLVRTKRMLQLLATLKDHQILFFTCHLHLLQYFNDTQVMHLEMGSIKNNSSVETRI
jgi:uncharacterized protein YhaN